MPTLFIATSSFYLSRLNNSSVFIMIALFTLLSFVFYMASAAPLLSGNNDQKMLNGQSSYQSFSFLDLPVIAKLPKDLNDAVVSEHQVKADLAVVESDEADNTGPEQIDGYGDSKPLDMSVETENKDSSPKPIGVVPKLTGTIIGAEPKVFTDKTGAAITNPTAYFLEGVDLEKVTIYFNITLKRIFRSKSQNVE